MDPGWLEGLERVKRKHFLPTVLNPEEVRRLLGCLKGTPRLMAELIYGTGLRVNECVQLRVKDIDFSARTITVRSGKGGKDRTTFLPRQLEPGLQRHLVRLAATHSSALNRGRGYVPLPGALARKYPNAARSFGWQYVFPSTVERRDPRTGQLVRWHTSPSTLQRAVHEGLVLADIRKHASVHTLRHCFATHLLQSGCDIRTIQTLMGHRSLETTMIYTHVAKVTEGVTSPFDRL